MVTPVRLGNASKPPTVSIGSVAQSTISRSAAQAANQAASQAIVSRSAAQSANQAALQSNSSRTVAQAANQAASQAQRQGASQQVQTQAQADALYAQAQAQAAQAKAQAAQAKAQAEAKALADAQAYAKTQAEAAARFQAASAASTRAQAATQPGMAEAEENWLGCIDPTGFEWSLPSGKITPIVGAPIYIDAYGDQYSQAAYQSKYGVDPEEAYTKMRAAATVVKTPVSPQPTVQQAATGIKQGTTQSTAALNAAMVSFANRITGFFDGVTQFSEGTTSLIPMTAEERALYRDIPLSEEERAYFAQEIDYRPSSLGPEPVLGGRSEIIETKRGPTAAEMLAAWIEPVTNLIYPSSSIPSSSQPASAQSSLYGQLQNQILSFVGSLGGLDEDLNSLMVDYYGMGADNYLAAYNWGTSNPINALNNAVYDYAVMQGMTSDEAAAAAEACTGPLCGIQSALTGTIEGLIGPVLSAINTIMQTISGYISNLTNNIKSLAESAKSVLDTVLQAVMKIPGQIEDAVTGIYTKMEGIINQIPGWIKGAYDWATQQVSTIATTIYDKLKAAYDWAQNNIATVVGAVVTAINPAILPFLNLAKTVLENMENIKGWVSGLWDNARGMIDSVVKQAQQVWDYVTHIDWTKAISEAIMSLISWLSSILMPLLEKLIPTDEQVRAALKGALDTVESMTEQVAKDFCTDPLAEVL